MIYYFARKGQYMNKNLIDVLAEEKIYPIIRNKNVQEVIDISKALVDGGIKVLEINLESPEIYGAIAEVSKFATVCAGGVITSLQANSAIGVGAEIISSPIFQQNLVKISKDTHIPLMAGATTPNEAYNVWKSRVPLIKLYPVFALGGAAYVENILRPMPFLKVIPQGNVKLNEVKSYIKAGALAVGVGRNFYEGHSFAEIKRRTANILKELKG